jgi:recombinase
MTKVERICEILSGPLESQYLKQKAEQGWTLISIRVAVEWQREAEVEAQAAGTLTVEVPFGLQVAKDCLHLEENPTEKQILILIMELFVQDLPLSVVADELNRRGFRTRQGSKWTQASVFDLFPRIVEVGPRIFSSEEWAIRRQRLFPHVKEESRRDVRLT